MNIQMVAFQKKRKLFGLLLLIFILLMVIQVPVILSRPNATDVGGPIVSDTIWTLSNSPYIVVESVEVWEGVTLTIEPGVEVRFNQGKQLQISGELDAQSTVNQPIVFTSNQPDPQPGDWGGIEFTDISVDATFNGSDVYVSGSILQYCVVEYAGNNLESAIHAPQAAPFIDHCTVQSNDSRGVSIAGSPGIPAIISYNIVVSNSTSGDGGGIHALYSKVSNNIVNANSATEHNSNGGGIFAQQSVIISNTVNVNSARYGGGISAQQSTVSNNTVNANSATRGGGIYASYSTVSNNSANTNSVTMGGGIYATYSTVSTNVVNANSATYIGGGIYADHSIVSNNSINNNNSDDLGGGISAYFQSTVSNNVINANSARYGGGIFVRESTVSTNIVSSNSTTYRGGGIYTDNSGIITNTIVRNTAIGQGAGVYFNGSTDFIGNTVIGNIGLVTQVVGGVEIFGTPEFHYNNLYNNSPYDVVVITPLDINGTLNFWGTANSVDILTQVYDWYDDSNLGKLLYIPFLQEPDSSAPVPPPLNLDTTFGEDFVTLIWDTIPGTTTSYGHKIYYGANVDPPYDGTGLLEGDSPINVGNLTTFTLTNLIPAEAYYFAVTTYDTQGRESWYSEVVRTGASTPVSITKSVAPQGQVNYGDELIYTLVISATPGVQVGIYDSLEGINFSRFLAQPAGVTQANNVITGTLTITPTNQMTISFVTHVNIPGTLGWTVNVTNRACIYSIGGTLGGCVWSNEVTNPAFRPYSVYLPVVLREN